MSGYVRENEDEGLKSFCLFVCLFLRVLNKGRPFWTAVSENIEQIKSSFAILK